MRCQSSSCSFNNALCLLCDSQPGSHHNPSSTWILRQWHTWSCLNLPPLLALFRLFEITVGKITSVHSVIKSDARFLCLSLLDLPTTFDTVVNMVEHAFLLETLPFSVFYDSLLFHCPSYFSCSFLAPCFNWVASIRSLNIVISQGQMMGSLFISLYAVFPR